MIVGFENYLLTVVLWMSIGYFCGALPFGYWLVKALKNIDLTQMGSGGTGTTNVKRAAGWPLAILTLFLDALKGALPTYYALHVLMPYYLPQDSYQLLPVLVAIASVVGHSKSFWLGFKGGKSVATGLGVFLVLQPVLIGFALLVAIPVMAITRYVSLGSIIACVLAFILAVYFKIPLVQQVFTLIVAVYIIYLHRANIGRLIARQENKI